MQNQGPKQKRRLTYRLLSLTRLKLREIKSLEAIMNEIKRN
jgi:hypothetical protein